MRNHLLILFVLAFSLNSMAAGPFKIINRQGTNPQTEALFNRLEVEVNKELPDSDIETYAPGMANAAALAVKGTGSDHSNDLDFMMISANVGAAIDSDSFNAFDYSDSDFDESTVDGVGVAASLTLGMNLGTFVKKKIGFIDPSRLDLFVNYVSFEEGGDGADDDFTLDHSNFGFHARYHIHQGYSLFSQALLKWGGVFITTGIERTNLKVGIAEVFAETETEAGATATLDGKGSIGIDTSVTSIPIEVSTYLQAFYVLSVYGGLGVDLNFGDSDVTAAFNGDVQVSGTASGSGDAVLDLSGTGDVDSLTARAFLGLQVNIPIVKIYAQYTKQIGTDLSSVNAGVKFIW